MQASIAEIKRGFNKDLFLALSPPFPKVELRQFEGSRKGDLVSLQLNFGLFKQTWTSKIVEDHEHDHEWLFVDVGTELPFFLKAWSHRHMVRSQDGHRYIIDDIEYSTGTVLTDWLMFLPMLGQFLYRKPIYRRFFSPK